MRLKELDKARRRRHVNTSLAKRRDRAAGTFDLDLRERWTAPRADSNEQSRAIEGSLARSQLAKPGKLFCDRRPQPVALPSQVATAGAVSESL